MKFKQDLIQKLRNGEIYLRKDNSNIAREVLMHAFPQDKYLSEKHTPVFDYGEFFRVSCHNKNFWLKTTDSYKPAINATHFVEQEEWMPKCGERVLVWDDEGQESCQRIFLTHIYGAIHPYVVVAGGWEKEFDAGKGFLTAGYKHAKPLPEKETKTERWPDIIEAYNTVYKLRPCFNSNNKTMYSSFFSGDIIGYATVEELKESVTNYYYADNK